MNSSCFWSRKPTTFHVIHSSEQQQQRERARTSCLWDWTESVIRQIDMCHWYGPILAVNERERETFSTNYWTIDYWRYWNVCKSSESITTTLPIKLDVVAWLSSSHSNVHCSVVVCFVSLLNFIELGRWWRASERERGEDEQYRRQTRAKKKHSNKPTKEKKITNESDKFDSRFYLYSKQA